MRDARNGSAEYPGPCSYKGHPANRKAISFESQGIGKPDGASGKGQQALGQSSAALSLKLLCSGDEAGGIATGPGQRASREESGARNGVAQPFQTTSLMIRNLWCKY